MKAVAFTEFGGPEVLRVLDLPEPHAGPGQVRVRVRAAGVQPYDAAVRAGWEPPGLKLGWPRVPVNEFAGVVDEGELEAGTEVLGFTAVQAAAEYIVVPATDVTPKPPDMPWEVAGGFTAGTQTASIALEALNLREGETLLVHGAAGSVGTAAVQLARLQGARVVGTASEANQDYLREIGAIPVRYGEGVADRVRAAAGGQVDAVFDVAGKTPIEQLTSLVSAPSRVLSIANFAAAQAGARVTGGGEDSRPREALAEVAELLAQNKLVIKVQTFPFDRAAEAYRISQNGHLRGKLVLVP